MKFGEKNFGTKHSHGLQKKCQSSHSHGQQRQASAACNFGRVGFPPKAGWMLGQIAVETKSKGGDAYTARHHVSYCYDGGRALRIRDGGGSRLPVASASRRRRDSPQADKKDRTGPNLGCDAKNIEVGCCHLPRPSFPFGKTFRSVSVRSLPAGSFQAIRADISL